MDSPGLRSGGSGPALSPGSKERKELERREKEKEKEREKREKKEKKEKKKESRAGSGGTSPLLRRLSAFIKKTVASPSSPVAPSSPSASDRPELGSRSAAAAAVSGSDSSLSSAKSFDELRESQHEGAGEGSRSGLGVGVGGIGGAGAPAGGKGSATAGGGPAAASAVEVVVAVEDAEDESGSGSPQGCKGHEFSTWQLPQPTWCDLCDDFIWGLNQCSQCKVCKYTCHKTCLPRVTLDCDASAVHARDNGVEHVLPSDAPPGGQVEGSGLQGAGPQSLLTFLEAKDVRRKVEVFNGCTQGLPLELLDANDETSKHFKGFIRVAMNLSRPIRVAGGVDALSTAPTSNSPEGDSHSAVPTHPPPLFPSPPNTVIPPRERRHVRSASESMGVGFLQSLPAVDGEASFFLPKNVSKGLYLTSQTTAQEVISILLRKFKIVTTPRKFALFECNRIDGTSRRLRRYEEPLVLQLLWGGDNNNMVFCLQENQEDEAFPWEEFSVPELQTFLRILDMEESQSVERLKARYEQKRLLLEEAVAQIASAESSSVSSAEDDEASSEEK